MRLACWRIVNLISILLVSAFVAISNGQVVLPEANCSVTVLPGQSIQRALEKSSEGAIICLGFPEGADMLSLQPQRWLENIVIRKSITLQGVHNRLTRLEAQQNDRPVILVSTD